jgi:ABC-2 type transport system ATP-binding protein
MCSDPAPLSVGRMKVSAHNLTKDFGPIRAVEDVSFEVLPGRVVGLIGPNGSGKTTILRMLLGLVTPTSGQALIGGRRLAELEEPARVVGAVLESRAFDGARSGRDHLRVVATEARLPLERVDEVLDQVGLAEAAGRRAKGYSLGMGQRLSLAAALLGDPEVLMLDEPTNGLDPAGIRWLRELLRRFAAEGRTVVVSSHALAEMQQTADEVLIMHGGRLLAQRSTAEIESLEDAFLDLTADADGVLS